MVSALIRLPLNISQSFCPSVRPSVVRLSSLLRHACLRMETKCKTHTHTVSYMSIATHWQTGTIAFLTDLTRARTHTRRCRNHLYAKCLAACGRLLWLLLPGYVTRSCRLLYLLFVPIGKGVSASTYRAGGEKITPPVGARRTEGNNRVEDTRRCSGSMLHMRATQESRQETFQSTAICGGEGKRKLQVWSVGVCVCVSQAANTESLWVAIMLAPVEKKDFQQIHAKL